MYHPTTRVLTALELLQSHPEITGAEIAQRLEVDARTARRYIAMLEELGVPVTADRGRHGGYRLMPGYKLPPLMFNNDEALAVVLGLMAARRLGLAPEAPGVEGALAKLERVLPEQVRSRVRAVEKAVTWDLGGRPAAGPSTDVVLTLSKATHDRQRVTMRYRDADGDETDRRFDPYGLVCRRARWYAIGHCHLRCDERLFRLDRIMAVSTCEEVFDLPDGFDALAAVLASLRGVPRDYVLEVVLYTTLERAQWQISAAVATLEELEGGGILLRGYTDCTEWVARLIASLGCRFEVRQPPELLEALRRHAHQIAECVEMGPDGPGRLDRIGNDA